jgi:DNA-3-methyladenine glycosylase II
MNPHFWEAGQSYLSDRDPIIAKLIERYPNDKLRNRGSSLQSLLRAIVGQQISVKAADSVWLKLEKVSRKISLESLLKLSHEQLRSAGLSRQKASYIQNIVTFYAENSITDDYWKDQSYEKSYKELIAIKGVGRWTIEMFAIFYLHEPDIFSVGDIGIQKAISQLYFDGQPQTKETLQQFSEQWAPYRTIALWYLWRHLDPEPINY